MNPEELYSKAVGILANNGIQMISELCFDGEVEYIIGYRDGHKVIFEFHEDWYREFPGVGDAINF